ncbi:MAG: ATP-binding cassette domain-containing protein, partial [Rudaea sp.]
GIDLDVYRGEIVGIVGATGSGKSTLLQHLNGLVRPGPQDGRVVVDGVDLSDPRADVRALRRKVGLVFQYSERQLFERYVGDDVAFGPRQYGLDKGQVREHVKQAMERVGLDFLEFKDRRTLTLSGGERRRAALAGVLALAPRVLVLDEPTAGLDPRGRDGFLQSLKRWRDEGVTVVLVSHHMDEVARVCDRVYVLADGRVAATGSPRELFAGGVELDALGLVPPPAVRLMRSLRARGVPVSGRALTVEDAAAELAALLQPRAAV